MNNKKTWFGVFGAAACIAIASPAVAQPLPEGVMGTDKATEGRTDVAKGGFESADRFDKGDSKDTTELKLSAGGLLTSGNAPSRFITGSGKFKMRRELNQLTASVAANYAQTQAPSEDSLETTVENLQGRVRYDRFFTDVLAGFLAVSATRDRFQGLDLRLSIDPGLAFYIIDDSGQQLWAEAGYDFQYDMRRDDAIDAAALEGEKLDETEVRHNARAFVGYDYTLSEEVTFNTGVEYIQSVEESKNWRLNWNFGISSNLGKSFAAATTFALKYDHNPLPGIEELDTVAAVSIVYNML
ncbi:MAG: hypothetical protein CSA75_01265 [Sorangium cellulosum]|nr:MAG: hypothetical protein CSA75_01265 [Sorangium cellulosum]